MGSGRGRERGSCKVGGAGLRPSSSVHSGTQHAPRTWAEPAPQHVPGAARALRRQQQRAVGVGGGQQAVQAACRGEQAECTRQPWWRGSNSTGTLRCRLACCHLCLRAAAVTSAKVSAGLGRTSLTECVPTGTMQGQHKGSRHARAVAGRQVQQRLRLPARAPPAAAAAAAATVTPKVESEHLPGADSARRLGCRCSVAAWARHGRS